MSGQAGVPEGAFSDSRATLRQVEGVLDELGADGTEMSAMEEVDAVISGLEHRPTGLKELVQILVKTYTEIMEVIDSLRRSRGLLEQAAMERLQNTNAKLAEVTTATEMAATGMLDGLDRALCLVDHIESASATEGRESDHEDEAGEYRNELRDELHSLINLLQFQDITSQQLGYASTVLSDIEERMVRLAQVFDLRGMGLGELSDAFVPEAKAKAKATADVEEDEADGHITNDPEASHFNAEGRQALADEIFT